MVVVHPEYAMLILELNDLKEEISDLIVEGDTLTCFICKDVEIDYMLKIGALEYKLIVAENEYKRNCRKMELIEQELKKSSKFNLTKIENKLKKEFKDEEKIEQDMLADIDLAIDMTSYDLYDYDMIEEMNIDYYKLQKMYNPIFNLEETEEQNKFYEKIRKYYQKGNYKKLHKLAENYNEDDIFQDEIGNLKKLKKKYEKILREYKKNIRKIKNAFPYNQRVILEDENLCRRKKDRLNKEIIEINVQNKKLKKKIENKLKKI